VHAWAAEQGLDVTKLLSNTFEMEWPPKSGKRQSFPEIDRVQWFSPEEAQEKMIPVQFSFVMELQNLLKHKG
jgi:predicted NUDIX family NTP pyrophosphohydrolase